MATDTGFGTSSGVAYTYDLFDDFWFGRYVCRVDKSFLEFPYQEFYTDVFHIGGYAWKLFLEPTNDGSISAFLYRHGSCSSFVYFSLSLLNRDDSRTKIWGSCKDFAAVPSWGVRRLASVDEIKDPAAGFINRGFLLIRLKMRFRRSENELSLLSADAKSASFTWNLKELYDKGPSFMLTEPFHVDNTSWRLAIYPRGMGRNKNHMSAYLYSNNERPVKAKFRLTVENHVSKDRTISKGLVHNFTRCRQAHGWGRFLELTCMENASRGFVKDGWISLTARVSVHHKSVRISEPTAGWQAILHQLDRDEDGRGALFSIDEVQTLEFPQEASSRTCGQRSLEVIQSTDNTSWELKNQKRQVTTVAEKQTIDKTTSPHEARTESSEWLESKNSNTLSTVLVKKKEDSIQSRCLGDIPRWLAHTKLDSPAPEPADGIDLLENLDNLLPGVSFASKYLIESDDIPEKPNVRFATNKFSKQSVILKFYTSRRRFEKSLELTQMLSSNYVCKAIEIIDDAEDGYPPCLVFEKGSETLDEWMQSETAYFSEKRAALFEILQCLEHIHSHGVIHTDINPSNIMFFPSSQSWKLVDTDLGVRKGRPRRIWYTTMYASPEIIQAEERGDKTVILEPAADMFSFGIIAYEILTDVRFHGLFTSEEAVKDSLCGRRPLRNLDYIEDAQAKVLLSRLLSMEPRERYSAERARHHAFFQSVDKKKPESSHSAKTSEDEVKYEPFDFSFDSPGATREMTAERRDFNFDLPSERRQTRALTRDISFDLPAARREKKVESRDISFDLPGARRPMTVESRDFNFDLPSERREKKVETHDIRFDLPRTMREMKVESPEARQEAVNFTHLTLEETRLADLMVTIVVEESILEDASASRRNKAFREALMMHGDDTKDEPVFLLLVGHAVRLRVSLRHRFHALAQYRKISRVRVRALDGRGSIYLTTEEIRSPNDGHEIVAFLNPLELQSRNFRCVSPMVGSLEEKYAILEVAVEVATDECGESQLLELKGNVVCNMTKYGRQILFRRFIERSGDLWNRAPEWVKNGAKGAIILATVGGNMSGIESHTFSRSISPSIDSSY